MGIAWSTALTRVTLLTRLGGLLTQFDSFLLIWSCRFTQDTFLITPYAIGAPKYLDGREFPTNPEYELCSFENHRSVEEKHLVLLAIHFQARGSREHNHTFHEISRLLNRWVTHQHRIVNKFVDEFACFL